MLSRLIVLVPLSPARSQQLGPERGERSLDPPEPLPGDGCQAAATKQAVPGYISEQNTPWTPRQALIPTLRVTFDQIPNQK